MKKCTINLYYNSSWYILARHKTNQFCSWFRFYYKNPEDWDRPDYEIFFNEDFVEEFKSFPYRLLHDGNGKVIPEIHKDWKLTIREWETKEISLVSGEYDITNVDTEISKIKSKVDGFLHAMKPEDVEIAIKYIKENK